MKKLNGYELIPDIINKVNNYSDKLKDRVKIDNIFNEIDLYASDGFKQFIKLSDNRYKCIKSGISLNDLLERQKNEYKEVSDNILENNFYMNNEIEKESKKLYKKLTIKESKELFKIRRNIINLNRNLSQNDLIKKKYENKIKAKSVNKDDNSSNGESKIKQNNTIINKEKDEKIYKDKKKYLSDIVEMDKKYFNKNIESYKNFLKDIEKTKDNSKILKIMSRNDNLGHKYSFKFKNIKLLSFKEEKKEEDVIQKKMEEDSRIDIKTLMKYTKRGNKKWFQEQLKQKSNKRLAHILNKRKKNDELLSNNENEIKSLLNKNALSTINANNKNIFNNTTFTNFGNTIKTVKNEAQFIKNIKENFDIKRQTVNKFFKNNSLPTLDQYEMKKSFQKKDMILSPVQKKDQHITLMFNLNRDTSNNDDEMDKKLKEIYDIFKNTYYSKIRSWSQEENEKKEIKQKEDQINENNRKYLNEINKIKRKAHLFVDIYSLRDGFVNEGIKLFNNSLNGPLYSKGSMQEKINEFNNYIEYKERERMMNEELLKQKQIEEEKKLREEDAEYQVMQKMKKNLNLDNNLKKDEERINFKSQDSKVKYTNKNKKNINKNKTISEQAFKDYLESIGFVKQKSINKEEL